MRQMFDNPAIMRQMMNPDMLEAMLQMRQTMGGMGGMPGAGMGTSAGYGGAGVTPGANPWAAMLGGMHSIAQICTVVSSTSFIYTTARLAW